MKYNTAWFINKAVNVHGDRYDYSIVDYKNSITKIKIICNTHGIFEQLPNDHTSHKNGCPTCGKESQIKKVTLSQDEIICSFNKVWNYEYDYSKFLYSGTFGKSTIICNKHGEFKKSATAHLNKQGCGKCVKENIKYIKNGKEVVHLTESVFLEKADKLHNSRFDYKYIRYVDSNTKINIRCKKHDSIFQQTPLLHVRGKGGCPKCKADSTTKAFLKDLDYFKTKSNEVHLDYYDYSESVYKGNKIKLKIGCPLHGIFEQKPNDHIGGHGCKKCGQKGSTYNITKAERNKEDWIQIQTTLYFLEFKSEFENYLKIGITNEKDLRHSVLERVTKCEIVDSLILDIDLYNAVIIEQTIIKENKDCCHVPLNTFAGYTECFEVSCKKDLKNKIINLLKNKAK